MRRIGGSMIKKLDRVSGKSTDYIFESVDKINEVVAWINTEEKKRKKILDNLNRKGK